VPSTTSVRRAIRRKTASSGESTTSAACATVCRAVQDPSAGTSISIVLEGRAVTTPSEAGRSVGGPTVKAQSNPTDGTLPPAGGMHRPTLTSR
jgi:hypothetical protein